MNLNEVEYNMYFEMGNIFSMYLMHNDIKDYHHLYMICLMVFLKNVLIL